MGARVTSPVKEFGSTERKNSQGKGVELKTDAKAKTAEKVRKQKVLEKVPNKVYDAKATDKGDSDIRKAAKAAAQEDTAPLYKPIHPKPHSIDVPIEALKAKFGFHKSGNPPKKSSFVKSATPEKVVSQKKKSVTYGVLKAGMPGRADFANQTVPQPRTLEEQEKYQPLDHLPIRQQISIKNIMQITSKGPAAPEPPSESHKKAVIPRGKFGNPVKDWKAAKMSALKSDLTVATKFLSRLRDKAHSRGDLNKLAEFGIPDQRQLLTVALSSDSRKCDFGGKLRHYYSPVIKEYIPNNTLNRYRGIPPDSMSLSAIDVLSLGTKQSFQVKEKEIRMESRDDEMDALHKVAMDEKHFLFLKELVGNQAVSVPLTLIHDIAIEVFPIVNEMQAFYYNKLGSDHECTVQATDSFIKILNRIMMYNSM